MQIILSIFWSFSFLELLSTILKLLCRRSSIVLLTTEIISKSLVILMIYSYGITFPDDGSLRNQMDRSLLLVCSILLPDLFSTQTQIFSPNFCRLRGQLSQREWLFDIYFLPCFDFLETCRYQLKHHLFYLSYLSEDLLLLLVTVSALFFFGLKS